MLGMSLLDLRGAKKSNISNGYPYRDCKQFSIPCAIQVGIQMTKALRDLHELGYLHKDIKPNNILTSVQV